jgi:hypothetical protein
MAVQTANGLNKAPGDTPATPEKTPAPTADAARSSSWGRSGYGSNAEAAPSSIPPGTRLDYPGMKATPDDPVLEQIISQGLRADDASPIKGQIRSLSDRNVPDHPQMTSNRARQPSSGNRELIPGAITPTKGGGTGRP